MRHVRILGLEFRCLGVQRLDCGNSVFRNLGFRDQGIEFSGF